MRKHNSASIMKCIALRLAPLVVCLFFALPFAVTSATEPYLIDEIRCQTNVIHSAAEDMHDEIKTHFRGTRGYGKLIGVNAQIKSRSAAILRRIDRNQCYRGMERDIAKLNQLSSELSDVYNDAMVKSNVGIGRMVVGSTDHVVDKMVGMIVLADSLKAASLGQGVVAEPAINLGQPQFAGVSEFDPNIELAPAVSAPTVEQRLRPGYEAPPSLETQTLTIEGPKPVFRSVLEK